MTPNANAKHFRLKAAQRDLVAAAGGIERAAEICSYGKSTVGRWAKIDSPEIMDPAAVEALEAETGMTPWTSAWLANRGMALSGDVAGPAGACLATEMAALSGSLGALFCEWSLVAADGHGTPAEADRMLRVLADVTAAIEKLKDASAKVIAEGGAPLFAPRVVGGGRS